MRECDLQYWINVNDPVEAQKWQLKAKAAELNYQLRFEKEMRELEKE